MPTIQPVTEGPVRYPTVEVKLTEVDGNVYAIIGAVSRGLRRAGVVDQEILEFAAEATSGDYDHLLQTAMRWVQVS